MDNNLDVKCKEILNKYSKESIEQMQIQILKYIKTPIMRISIDMADKKCYLCAKKPTFYETKSANLLCWKHANELTKKTD